jgi:hypothetical protein
MRWISNAWPFRPKFGETFTKTFFAICPRCINREYRWLEKVTIEYKYIENSRFIGGYWQAIRYIDV